MSTCAQTFDLDPNDPRLTEVLLPIPFIPPAPSTPYELRLVAHGLTKQATRMAVNRVLARVCNASKDRSDRRDTWNIPLFTTMLRSEPYHAKQLAKQQEVKYSFFRQCSKSQFTAFEIEFLDTSCCEDEFEITGNMIRRMRDILERVIGERMVDKIGAWVLPQTDTLLGIKLKVMVASRLDEAMKAKVSQALQDDDEVEADVEVANWRVFDKENFNEELRRLAAPDLPPNGTLRADFEMLLRHVQQIHSSGFTREERQQFVLSSTDNANLQPAPMQESLDSASPQPLQPVEPGKIRMSNVPRSPKTGRPARFISRPMDINTRPEDIDDSDWLEIVPTD